MKRKIAIALLMGAMVFGTSTVAQAESGWYELNGNLITVHVPLVGNADWDVIPSDPEGAELITNEISNGEWVATYAYDGDYEGYDRLEVICTVDGVSYGHYTVDMWYSENGDIEVTDAYGDVYYDEDSSSYDEDDTEEETTEFAQADFDAYTAYVNVSDGLLLRNGPGSEYDVIGSLDPGEKVTVVGMSNGWAMVYDETGRTGYCSAGYLSTEQANVSGSSSASKANESEAEAEETCFELDDTGKVLTLRLPADTQNQNAWNYTFSDPDAMELITQETVTTDTAGEKWVASFKAAETETNETTEASEANEVSLIATRIDEKQHINLSYLMDLRVDEDGTIRVISVQKQWLETDDETGILIINLQGNQEQNKTWKYSVENADIAELINCSYIEKKDNTEDETVTDGYWNGSFRGLEAGETILTMTYGTENETEKTLFVHLGVDQNGNLHVASVKEK